MKATTATLAKSILAGAVIALGASGAQAAPVPMSVKVDVNDTTYILGILDNGDGGSYEDFQTVLEATPWWGDFSLAKSFSEAYAKLSGEDDFGLKRVYFAYEERRGDVKTWYVKDGERVSFDEKDDDDDYAYVVGKADVNENAAVIPLPATAPLLIAGLGGLGWLARRRKKSA